MNASQTKANRLDIWGDSLLNKLPARSRRRRKRQASKKRRAQLKRELLQARFASPRSA